jgi:hypothetical protein
MLKHGRERYRVPRCLRDVIPVQAIWKDGIFRVGSKYSMTFSFTDINYQAAGKKDKETMFFGLSMRQFFFSIAAMGVAVLLYFLLKDNFGVETVSWMCILGAAPFAAMGFVTYHGMTAEQFIWAFIRSELLEHKVLFVKHNNLYYEILKEAKTK